MAHTPSSYEEIAQSRPRIRRDVLFTQTPSGVLFHNAHGGFSVATRSAYRFATLLVPHLDGRRRVEELCSGMGTRHRDMVVQLVCALYSRGFARDAAPTSAAATLLSHVSERFAHQLDYLDHYADDAVGRFLRFRSTPVAVLGDDALARWAALGLLRNGCAAVAVTGQQAQHSVLSRERHGVEAGDLDAEVTDLAAAGCGPRLTQLTEPAAGTYAWDDLEGWDTVLVTGAAGHHQMLRLLTKGVPAGRRLLGAWTFGNSAVVGPVMTAGTLGCWCCAALRLGAGANAADSADLWSALGPAAPLDAPPPRLGGPLAGMLGNLLAFEVFRLVTGALPAETSNQIVVQDLDTLDVLSEPLLPHPRCPFCSGAATSAVEPATLTSDILRAAHADDEPTAHPADGASDEAARTALAALAERDILVQERAGVFTAYADEHWEQTPLKVGTLCLGLGAGRERLISAVDVHHVAGARLTALFRAAEVYVEHVVPPRVLDTVALEAAVGKWPRIEPLELAVSSGLDVPVDRIIHWIEATSLLDDQTVLVPAGAVRTLGGWNDEGLFERTSAGTGAAGSPRAALGRALRTALAHDALRGAVRRTAPVHVVHPVSLTGDPELLFLLRSAENLGVTVEVLDLTAAGGHTVPVVVSRLGDPETGEQRWSVACGLRRRGAAREALRDLIGREQLRRVAGPSDPGDPLWADLDAATLVAVTPAPAPDTVTTWAAVLDSLAAAGRDVLVVPVTAPDLAAGHVHAVRVLLTEGRPRVR
ncbi:TOMM precursor leader peptide-binding protein [Streptomyces sp. NPDC096324]|uniref:TOMM precursor leader peptide-binding protein n=1 Tax=Streptomyces sp. NPDC096324 TaxID=3366085 RepID=UPI0038058984